MADIVKLIPEVFLLALIFTAGSLLRLKKQTVAMCFCLLVLLFGNLSVFFDPLKNVMLSFSILSLDALILLTTGMLLYDKLKLLTEHPPIEPSQNAEIFQDTAISIPQSKGAAASTSYPLALFPGYNNMDLISTAGLVSASIACLYEDLGLKKKTIRGLLKRLLSENFTDDTFEVTKINSLIDSSSADFPELAQKTQLERDDLKDGLLGIKQNLSRVLKASYLKEKCTNEKDAQRLLFASCIHTIDQLPSRQSSQNCARANEPASYPKTKKSSKHNELVEPSFLSTSSRQIRAQRSKEL